MSGCAHLRDAPAAPPRADGCEECLATGSDWVHLRVCADCGHVGCCDSSPNRHARAHAASSGHPVARSYEPGEAWWWCYEDQAWVPERTGHPPLRPPLR